METTKTISQATTNILNEILSTESGKEIYSAFMRGPRANISAAFRKAASQGFITKSRNSRPGWTVWVRTDKDAAQYDANPPKKSRGPNIRLNRRRFLNAAMKGKLVARCDYRYTDDYAWDAAVNFGKMNGFLPVCIGENRPDHVRFHESDFRGSCGYIRDNGNGTYAFSVHSNLLYTIKIVD